ncbi:hypothetical protein WR25_17263 [Diploscapter pachys]|uniref:Uncharacterized protein n=1 Tax=Diploscapter pachys TaxID=2018661 RepID=A0A2A2K1A5_9BILA|nr:hypothetical protein WR25_17263 [Diploscapter pachys]
MGGASGAEEIRPKAFNATSRPCTPTATTAPGNALPTQDCTSAKAASKLGVRSAAMAEVGTGAIVTVLNADTSAATLMRPLMVEAP